MINRNAKRYCNTDISLVENYDKAIASSEMWDCHHKNEIILDKSQDELKEMGLYWNRPPEELIFLSHSEHASLHSKGRTYSLSNETKQNMSISAKKRAKYGKENPRYISVCPIRIAYLYNVERLSSRQIAKILGVSPSKIISAMNEHNIKRRTPTEYVSNYHSNK